MLTDIFLHQPAVYDTLINFATFYRSIYGGSKGAELS